MERARILLAEDHLAVAERLRDMLKVEFDVIAIVSSGYELLGAARVMKPDVVVTDIAMPGLDGLRAAEFLLAEDPRALIVAVSIHDDPGMIKRALEIGIMGFVSKSTGCGDLVSTIKTVLAARSRVSPTSSSPPSGGQP